METAKKLLIQLTVVLAMLLFLVSTASSFYFKIEQTKSSGKKAGSELLLNSDLAEEKGTGDLKFPLQALASLFLLPATAAQSLYVAIENRPQKAFWKLYLLFRRLKVHLA